MASSFTGGAPGKWNERITLTHTGICDSTTPTTAFEDQKKNEPGEVIELHAVLDAVGVAAGRRADLGSDGSVWRE